MLRVNSTHTVKLAFSEYWNQYSVLTPTLKWSRAHCASNKIYCVFMHGTVLRSTQAVYSYTILNNLNHQTFLCVLCISKSFKIVSATEVLQGALEEYRISFLLNANKFSVLNSLVFLEKFHLKYLPFKMKKKTVLQLQFEDLLDICEEKKGIYFRWIL